MIGSRPGAPRTPTRLACRRRTGRGSVGACGRTSSTACGHSTRRLFFSPPNERDHPCLGVTEHTLDRRARTKAGEPIGVEQTPGALRGSSHRQSVPDFRAPLKPAKPCYAWPTPRSPQVNRPHISTKSQKTTPTRRATSRPPRSPSPHCARGMDGLFRNLRGG